MITYVFMYNVLYIVYVLACDSLDIAFGLKN